jgi:hypothetical protein
MSKSACFKPIRRLSLTASIGFFALSSPACIQPARSLPPPNDTPEEVLRTEIVTEARSPVNGKPLTAAEYAQLQVALRNSPAAESQVNSQLKQLIFLLRVRKLLRTVIPFFPI